jgi:hypothetical protein
MFPRPSSAQQPGPNTNAVIVITDPAAIELFLLPTIASNPGYYEFDAGPAGCRIDSAVFAEFVRRPELWPPGMVILSLANITFDGPLDLSGIEYRIAIRLEDCQVRASVTLDATTWHGPVRFVRTIINGGISAESAEFRKGLLLQKVRCQESVRLARSIHDEPLLIYDTQIDGELQLQNSILTHGLLLLDVDCGPSVDGSGARVGTSLQLFNCYCHQDVDFSRVRVNDEVVLKETTVAGTLKLIGAEIGGLVHLADAHLASLTLADAVVEEELILLDSGFSVELRYVDWLGDDASLDLSGAYLGNFTLPDAGLPPTIDLRGLTYSEFRSNCLYCERSPAGWAAHIKTQLARQRPFSKTVYDSVAAKLREQGETLLADSVNYAGWQLASAQPGLAGHRRLWLHIDRATTGHGIYPARIVWWLTGWIISYILLTTAFATPPGLFTARINTNRSDAPAATMTATVAGLARLVLIAIDRLVPAFKYRNRFAPPPPAFAWVTGVYRLLGIALVAIIALWLVRSVGTFPPANQISR